MKSVAVLGLGVIALTTGAFITASAAAKTGRSSFEAEVSGAVRAHPAGDVAFGIVGDSSSGVAAFTITLGAEGSEGAILFTSLDGRMPAPGRYEVSGGGAEGFRASYVAGSADEPSGLFRADVGMLEITASTAEHISGHFHFTGTGFLTAEPSDEDSQVTVTGAFMATRTAVAVRE